jgi:hypothetical protein
MLHVSCASILKPAYLEMNSTLFAVWKPTENDGASFDHIVEMWSFLKENRVKRTLSSNIQRFRRDFGSCVTLTGAG